MDDVRALVMMMMMVSQMVLQWYMCTQYKRLGLMCPYLSYTICRNQQYSLLLVGYPQNQVLAAQSCRDDAHCMHL